MRIHRAMSVLIATLVLAGLVGSASAGKLSVTNRNFRIVWAPLTMMAFGMGVECNVTVEGSFHSATFTKIADRLIGYVTRARVGTCANGEIWALNGAEILEEEIVEDTLPWHVRYLAFTGTLPRPAGVRVGILDASFLAERLTLQCLYRSTGARMWQGTFELNGEGRITGFRSNETSGLLRFGGEGICPAEARLAGTGGVALLGTTATIRITLI